MRRPSRFPTTNSSIRSTRRVTSRAWPLRYWRAPGRRGSRSSWLDSRPARHRIGVRRGRYLDSLILAEVEDDLLEQCGVDLRHDPRETWLDTVKQRLRND